MALAASLLLASCHKDPPKTWDDNDHSTIRWVSNPAADLMSSQGTFVRAVTESMPAARMGQGRGIEAIRNGGYPGFEHALNNVRDPGFFDGDKHRYGNRLVGTAYNSVVGLIQQGDRYTAEICSDLRQTATLRDDGKYIMNNLENWVSTLSITFGPDPKIPSDQQHSPPPRQRGPAERPTDDVFGTWVLFDFKAASTPSPQCKSIAPTIPNEWAKPDLLRDPPPTLSPDPGWPQGSST
ncbi:hypothetical protein BKG78_23285 [Mycobacteroides chelonae]|nr:hypothetical protein BKG78_23285 [Mycobacteroides chelonae]